MQDLSVNVADNDEAGRVVDLVDGPLRVFEDARTTSSQADRPARRLITATYRIVLTRSPTESVRITAAPVPLREGERRAGAKGIGLAAARSTDSQCTRPA